MSQMKELYEKVAKDAGLQAKFAQITQEAEEAGKEATGEKLLAFAKEAGYEISLDEMSAFFQELAKENTGELSNLELDMVAGGKGEGAAILVGISILTFGIGCLAISTDPWAAKGENPCVHLASI